MVESRPKRVVFFLGSIVLLFFLTTSFLLSLYHKNQSLEPPEIFFAQNEPLSSVCKGGRYDLCSQAPKCGEYANKSFDWFAQNISQGLWDPDVHSYCGGSDLYCKGYVPFCCYEMVRLKDPDMCQGYDTLSCLPSQCDQVPGSYDRKNCAHGVKAYCPRYGIDAKNVQPVPLAQRFPNDVIFLRLDKAGDFEKQQVQSRRPDIWQMYLQYKASQPQPIPTATPLVPTPTTIPAPTFTPTSSPHTPTPAFSPTVSPVPTEVEPILPSPPQGCFYEAVDCFAEPCQPILVCPTPPLAHVSLPPPPRCTTSPTDIVLTFDASLSSGSKTPSGISKMITAQKMAKALVETIKTTNPSDTMIRLGVVSYGENSKNTTVMQSLTKDYDSVIQAIEKIQPTRPDECPECGIRTSMKVLQETTDNENRTRTIIFFSDGGADRLPNGQRPKDDTIVEQGAFAAAREAETAGIHIFAIGLGIPNDRDLEYTNMKTFASDPDDIFYVENPNLDDWLSVFEANVCSLPDATYDLEQMFVEFPSLFSRIVSWFQQTLRLR